MAHIEFHPENGNSPWVIRADGLWLAYRTEDEAKDRLPGVAFVTGQQWSPEQIEAMRRQRA